MIKFILKDVTLELADNFHFFSNIDQKIYQTLISERQYIIKSQVCKETLESFINFCINGIIPDFSSNISEYDQLSREFDIMRNLIQLYQQKTQCYEFLSLTTNNSELKSKLKESKEKYNSRINNYQQIIHSLFHGPGIYSQQQYLEVKQDLFEACTDENAKLIFLFTRKNVKINDLTFVLNEDDKTAGIFNSSSAKGGIFIPRSIEYNGEEYVIKTIYEKSFEKSRELKSIEFSNDSELQVIEKESFLYSYIESITIPSTVTDICSRAFHYSKLSNIIFKEDSKLKILEDECFYSCLFDRITIPKHVVKIGTRSISQCRNLKKIFFQSDSELRVIESDAFSLTPIEEIEIPSNSVELKEGWCGGMFALNRVLILPNNTRYLYMNDSILLGKSDEKSDSYDVLLFVRRDIDEIVIPSFVRRIASKSFDNCQRLHCVEFCENSQLEEIDKDAFSCCEFEKMSLPSSILKFNEGCFYQVYKLKDISIIQSNNVNSIIYYDNKFILGKSSPFCSDYDILYFARRDIKEATIPSTIKKIASFAFADCNMLKSVTFEDNSQLNEIGKYSFAWTSIKRITIPSSVTKIDECAFFFCKKLEFVDFFDDSRLHSIENGAFNITSLVQIKIPSHVYLIGSHAFSQSEIKIFEFAENSELLSIGNMAFCDCEFSSFSIPKSVIYVSQKAFWYCENLEIIEFDENSKLHRINIDNFDPMKSKIMMVPHDMKDPFIKIEQNE